jgi:hypothetical protein
MAALYVTRRPFTDRRGRDTRLGRLQIDSRATRLGQADRHGLSGRTCAVLAGPDMLNLFPDELPGLRAGRFALPPVAANALHRTFLRHGIALLLADYTTVA